MKHFNAEVTYLSRFGQDIGFLKSGPFRRNLACVIDYGLGHKIEQNSVEDTKIGQEMVDQIV